MGSRQLELDGKFFVILGWAEHERLTKLANAAQIAEMLQPDAEGNYPGVAYARASLARKINQARRKAGLSQEHLARLCQTDFRAVCRVESVNGVPSMSTMRRINEVLKRYEGRT